MMDQVAPDAIRQFDLNEDQRAIREMAQSFAQEQLAPRAIEWDQEKHFPSDVLRKAAAVGMGGIYTREDFGGSGLTRLEAALIFEALAFRLSLCGRGCIDAQHGHVDDRPVRR